jgi:uncharacterized surface protein with fasciclin (FAS1) repeats
MATGDYLVVEKKSGGYLGKWIKIISIFEAANGVIHVIDDVFLPNGK